MSSEAIPARFGSGQAVQRIEDDGLLRGEGKYTDDVAMPKQTWLAFVRSPHAHATINSIDTADAKAMDGVVAIFTGQDLIDAGVKPLPPAGAGFKRADGSDGISPDRTILATDRVRYVGDSVAIVVGETRQIATDAAEAVMVDYDELPVLPSLEAALASDAATIVKDAPDNICAEMKHGDADASDAAFKEAAHVVSLDLFNQRLAPTSIEPRSVLAYVGDDGRLTVRMSTQMPTGVRTALADQIFGVEHDQIRVVVGDVGGGFGMKTGIYPEDCAVAFAAKQVNRPVRWIADRGEDLLSAVHGRDVTTTAALALDKEGKILSYRIRSDANVGAYANPTGVAIQVMIGPWVATSIYDVPVIDFHFRAILTNQAPTAAYRGAGRPEAIYITERLMDEAARQLKIAPEEIRIRNLVKSEQMPYQNAMAQTYDTGEFEKIVRAGLKLGDWDGFSAREKQSESDGKLRGRGMASFLEWTGGNVFEERVTVNVAADGVVEIMTALMPMGQGINTSFAQLVVDTFGIPIEKIRVKHGDTDLANGFGSAGSRSIFAGGSAVRVAAERTIEKAKELAADALECSAADIEYDQANFKVAGTDRSIGLFELAAKQADQQIEMDSTSSTDGSTWPNGCHVCEVEIDKATGEVQVAAYANVNDVGKVINPLIVTGQLEGGAVQGIGQALFEQVVYDDESGQLQTGSLMDYTIPRADIMGQFKTEMDQSIPCKNNPLGVKGVGELGTIGATPAVVNAVLDALFRAGVSEQAALGMQMPLTPDKVWQVLQTA
jgi:carbon-monoxide dehydrogenase large subunit